MKEQKGVNQEDKNFKKIDISNPKLVNGIKCLKLYFKQGKSEWITKEKEIMTKYKKLFSPKNLNKLTKKDFEEFTKGKNNCHWNGITRHNPTITKDMKRLICSLKLILDEKHDIKERLNKLIPKNKPGYVKGLGQSILTPILFLVYPHKYGVLNKTTRTGMEFFNVYPFKKRPKLFSEEYVEVNKIINEIEKKYDVTKWQIDSMWYFKETNIKNIKKKIIEDVPEEESIENIIEILKLKGRNGENKLKRYMYNKWEEIKGFENLQIYTEEGATEPTGKEYHLKNGMRIDFLCEDKKGHYVIVEVKITATSNAVGQVFSYIQSLKQEKEKKKKIKEAIILCINADKGAILAAKEESKKVKIKKIDFTFQVTDV